MSVRRRDRDRIGPNRTYGPAAVWSRRAAAVAFATAALAVGYFLGAWSVQLDAGDLREGRRQGYDRSQCYVDYLSVDPSQRVARFGEDVRLTVLCPKLQEAIRPDDPPPDVGEPPTETPPTG